MSEGIKILLEVTYNVIIMLHKTPDIDSLGATIGVLNIAKSNDKECYIFFDQDDVLTGVSRVIEEIKEDGELWKHFISPTEAESIINEKSMIVVVDMFKPNIDGKKT